MLKIIKSLPIKKLALGLAAAVVLTFSILDVFFPQNLNVGLGFDEYDVLRIGTLGCRIHTDKGEVLELEPMKGSNELLIPKSSRISGDCFVVSP